MNRAFDKFFIFENDPVESDIFTGFHKMFLMLVFPVYRCEVLDGFYLVIRLLVT